jgi:hypothetical protein
MPAVVREARSRHSTAAPKVAVVPPCSTVEDGDVVIRRKTQDGRQVYVLHTAPGPDQYFVRSREEALTQAVTVAKHRYVRAWLTDGDDDFVLLEDFRAAQAV